MGRQENSAQSEIILEPESCALYNRGKDEIVQKIYTKIFEYDKYHSWQILHFKSFGSYWKIRRALDKLVAQGYLIKVQANPVFYERKS